jgi:hypothetical protein
MQLVHETGEIWCKVFYQHTLYVIRWHNFERDPPKDHPCQVWFNSVQGFQRRRFKCESLRRTTDADGRQVMAKAHMAMARWAKNSFIFIYLVIFASPRFLETVRSQYINKSHALHSRWLLLLKIEMSSIVHCCFSIIQHELKF